MRSDDEEHKDVGCVTAGLVRARMHVALPSCERTQD